MTRQDTIDKPQPVLKRGLQIGLMLGIQCVALFASAGTLVWGWAWVYFVIYLAGIAVTGALLWRLNPGLIAERASTKGAKGWDLIVGSVWALVYMVGLLVVAGLDRRLGWSGTLAAWIHLVGAAGFSAGLALFLWAMLSNARFATVVRVGALGEHAVCQSGPYRTVRHPGYTGAILQGLALPFLLGSWWALIPGVLATGLMALRTFLEDRTLHAELPGYQEYAERVRFRLLSGVW